KNPSLRLRFAWMVARAEIDLRDRRAWLSRRCTKYIPAPRSAIPGIAILLAGGIVTAALTETGEPRLMEEGVIGGLASVAAPVIAPAVAPAEPPSEAPMLADAGSIEIEPGSGLAAAPSALPAWMMMNAD